MIHTFARRAQGALRLLAGALALVAVTAPIAAAAPGRATRVGPPFAPPLAGSVRDEAG